MSLDSAAGGAAKENMMIATTSIAGLAVERPVSRADALKAVAVAAFLGGVLVFATGFAAPSVLHNAAHDSRHAMNFPCH